MHAQHVKRVTAQRKTTPNRSFSAGCVVSTPIPELAWHFPQRLIISLMRSPNKNRAAVKRPFPVSVALAHFNAAGMVFKTTTGTSAQRPEVGLQVRSSRSTLHTLPLRPLQTFNCSGLRVLERLSPHGQTDSVTVLGCALPAEYDAPKTPLQTLLARNESSSRITATNWSIVSRYQHAKKEERASNQCDRDDVHQRVHCRLRFTSARLHKHAGPHKRTIHIIPRE